jgi:hypothetical protein
MIPIPGVTCASKVTFWITPVNAQVQFPTIFKVSTISVIFRVICFFFSGLIWYSVCPTSLGCSSLVTCTSPDVLKCSECDPGYFLNQTSLCTSMLASTPPSSFPPPLPSSPPPSRPSSPPPSPLHLLPSALIPSSLSSPHLLPSFPSPFQLIPPSPPPSSNHSLICPSECTPVPQCLSLVSCTTATDSTCDACDMGWIKIPKDGNGTPDHCVCM